MQIFHGFSLCMFSRRACYNTERKSQEVISKLSTLTSRPQAKQLKPPMYIAGRAKGINEYDALLNLALNFNPRLGEVMFLSNEDSEVLDYIVMRQ